MERPGAELGWLHVVPDNPYFAKWVSVEWVVQSLNNQSYHIDLDLPHLKVLRHVRWSDDIHVFYLDDGS